MARSVKASQSTVSGRSKAKPAVAPAAKAAVKKPPKAAASAKVNNGAKTKLLVDLGVEAFIASLPADRQADITQLHALIMGVVKSLRTPTPVRMWGGASSRFIGYGTWKYKYASGREGEWFPVGLANQKQHISLYVCAVNSKGHYLAESAKTKLPKASIGKSCIRFRRLADVDLKVLADLAKQALVSPSFAM